MLKRKEDVSRVEEANTIMKNDWGWIDDGRCKDVLTMIFDGVDKVRKVLMLTESDDIFDTILDDEGKRYDIYHLISAFSDKQINPVEMKGLADGVDYRVLKTY